MSTVRDEHLVWIQRYADGIASAEEVARLQAALREEAALRKVFLDYVQIDSGLAALAALAAARGTLDVPDAARSASALRRGPRSWFRARAAILGATVAIALAAGVALSGWMRDRGRVAVEIVQSEEARWVAPGASLPRAGERLALQTISLAEGALSLRLEGSGVLLKLSAPLEARFETPMRLRVAQGRLSADVGKLGIGFTVVTDAGEIVDLGTSFGVEAERGGESRVAVFSGKVKVRRGAADEGNAFTTLSEGEAVRFSALAGLRRWEHVAMAAEAAGILARANTAVVGAVRDNLGDDELHPFYGVVSEGLRPGSLAFTDKPNPRWAPQPEDRLPAWLEGADLIRTYHQFRYRRDYELVLTLREASTVYVLIDPRQPAPAWLAEQFVETGVRVGVGPWQQGLKQEAGVDVRADGLPYLAFAVWRADASPGEFKLGAPRDSGRLNQALMYGVAVKARATSIP